MPRIAETKGTKRLPRGCKRIAAIKIANAIRARRYGKNHDGNPKFAESFASSLGIGFDGALAKARNQRPAQRMRNVANQSVYVVTDCNRFCRRCRSQKNPTTVSKASTAGPAPTVKRKIWGRTGCVMRTLISAKWKF